MNYTYSTSLPAPGRPAKATTYTLAVWARDTGETVSYDKYASLTYQVAPQPITAVTLAAAHSGLSTTGQHAGDADRLIDRRRRAGAVHASGVGYTNSTGPALCLISARIILRPRVAPGHPRSSGTFHAAGLSGHGSSAIPLDRDNTLRSSIRSAPQAISAVALTTNPPLPAAGYDGDYIDGDAPRRWRPDRTPVRVGTPIPPAARRIPATPPTRPRRVACGHRRPPNLHAGGLGAPSGIPPIMKDTLWKITYQVTGGRNTRGGARGETHPPRSRSPCRLRYLAGIDRLGGNQVT